MQRAGARHAKHLRLALVLIATFLVVQAVASFVTGSLALLSDAAHMLVDAVGLGLSLAAIGLANRDGAHSRSRTFGLYRLEVLAALANAVLLLGVSAYVLVEAVLRIVNEPSVDAGPMIVVAVIGLAVNVVAFLLLRPAASESLNVQGAYIEVLADLVGSVGVIGAGIIVVTTGWTGADAIVAAVIGLWIVPRTLRLASRSLRVLLQVAPAGLDVDGLRASLSAVVGVIDVHDLHVWTLTSEMDVASAHLMIGVDADAHGVLDRARELLRDSYGIAHATLQVEPDDHTGCEEVNW